MNSTQGDASSDTYASAINGTIGIALFVLVGGSVAIFVLLDLCLRQVLRRRRQGLEDRPVEAGASKGLDKAVLDSLPVFTAAAGDGRECAVCLSDFEAEERGKRLPKCNHAFHADCIDMWFFSHSTCPICRSSVTLADGTDGQQEYQAESTAAAPACPQLPEMKPLPPPHLVIDIPVVASASGTTKAEPDSPAKSPMLERLKSLHRLLSSGPARAVFVDEERLSKQAEGVEVVD